MKSKFTLLAALTAASLISSTAFAQAKNFQGWSMSLNAESASTTTSPVGAASQSANSSSLGLQPQYTWDLGNNFVLGAGLTIGIGENKAGSFGNAPSDTTMQSRLAFDLQPGYAFSDTFLGYLKLSSVGASYEMNTPGSPRQSTIVSGSSYGVGLRAMVANGMYIQTGYDTVRYDRVMASALWDMGVDAKVFSLGLGIKF